ERIAASEAALGSAKPGGANHPGQTNFIAAARRAAQAAAAAETEAPTDDESGDRSSKTISRRVRSLFVGASALVLIAAGARITMDLLDFGSMPVAEVTAPAGPAATPDADPQKSAQVTAPATLPAKHDLFATPPS